MAGMLGDAYRAILEKVEPEAQPTLFNILDMGTVAQLHAAPRLARLIEGTAYCRRDIGSPFE